MDAVANYVMRFWDWHWKMHYLAKNFLMFSFRSNKEGSSKDQLKDSGGISKESDTHNPPPQKEEGEPCNLPYGLKISKMLPVWIEPIIVSITLSFILMVVVSLATYKPERSTKRLVDMEK